MNLPNRLTVFRIICVPVEAFLMLWNTSPRNFLLAFILFLILAASDFFDGKIARRNNKITIFGKFMDPLADKILVMTVFICFLHLGLIGVVPVIIMMNREFIVTAIRLLAANKKVVISANFWGKLKTVFQMAVISMIFLNEIFLLHFDAVNIIISVSIYIMVAASVISGLLYFYDNRSLFYVD